MKRKIRAYKYECEDCGWFGYKSNLMDACMCSKCGSTKKPIVSTEDMEITISDAQMADIDRAKKYVERLMAGEDIEMLIDEEEKEQQRPETMIMRLLGGFEGHDFSVALASQEFKKIY